MRDAVFNSLFKRMGEDNSIFFITADMGLGLVERFEEAYPDRYVNCGIAEQNMIGLAAGLSNVGYRVCCYTVSQFYLRAFEQIRNEVGINGAPLILLGTTEGFDNAALGPSHHPIDDWGVLKAVPGLDIYCPSSTPYAKLLLDHVLAEPGAAYIRIPKGSYDEPDLIGNTDHFAGRNTLIVTYGNLAQVALKAYSGSCGPGVLVLNKLWPTPRIDTILAGYREIIVIEDQFAHVGLYSDICQMQTQAMVTSLAPSQFDLTVGTSPEAFHERYGMTLDWLTQETTVA